MVGRYAGLSQIEDKILDAVRVHQNDQTANDAGTPLGSEQKQAHLCLSIEHSMKPVSSIA